MPRLKKQDPRLDPALLRHLPKALKVAAAAAAESGALIHRKFGKVRHLGRKPDTSLVTEVDKKSEALILKKIKKHFPNDQVLAEETGHGARARPSLFQWHIDPLDGTTNFVHGFPIFCVSIGLEYLGPLPKGASSLVLGAIYQPMTKTLYSAYTGNGAYRNSQRIGVSGTSRVADALLSTGFSLKRHQYLEHEVDTLKSILNAGQGLRRTGSAAMDLTYVSTGQFDGFWERGLAPWDVAAGCVLVAEAGGCVTTLDGKPFRLGQDNIVASNGALHRNLLKVLTRRTEAHGEYYR